MSWGTVFLTLSLSGASFFIFLGGDLLYSCEMGVQLFGNVEQDENEEIVQSQWKC